MANKRSDDYYKIPKTKHSGYIEAACEYIKNNYMNDITVADISAHVAIDRTYMYRLFCREKGISPSKYLQRVRLEAAKELMDKGGHPLSEIPKLAGFHSRSRFAAIFKAEYGVLPRDYISK